MKARWIHTADCNDVIRMFGVDEHSGDFLMLAVNILDESDLDEVYERVVRGDEIRIGVVIGRALGYVDDPASIAFFEEVYDIIQKGRHRQ